MNASVRCLAISLFASLPSTAQAPVCRDATGMKWVMPFARAKAEAAAHRRIMMIKPIAFGTTADGGW